MSNLLQTEQGRAALYEARNYLLRRRLSRFFKRNLVIDYSQWSLGQGEFDLATLLGQLNPAHDDEIRDLYSLLGSIGGLENSLADTEIFVDADNGNDQTGTGSTDMPYASLWFVPYLPKNINHLYRIILRTDIDMGGDDGSVLSFTQNIGPNGCLVLAGYGEEEEVLGGLAATCTTQTVFESQEYSGLNPPPTTAIIGNFVQNTTVGARLGQTKPVVYYTWVLNGELLTNGAVNILVADTIRYVLPRRELRVKGLDLRLNCALYSDDLALDTGARFGILNLKIDIDEGSQQAGGQLNVNCVGDIVLSFVKIDLHGTNPASPIPFGQWTNGSLNRLTLQDQNIDTELGLGDLSNIRSFGGNFNCAGCIVHNVDDLKQNILNFSGASGADINNLVVNGKIRCFYFQGKLNVTAAYNGYYFWHCSVDLNNSITICESANGLDLYNSRARINELACQQCIQAVSVARSHLFLQSIGIEPTYGRLGGLPSYHVTAQGSFVRMSNAWNGMASGTADCRLPDSNPDVTGAFPAAGAQITDGLQSSVMRIG